MFGYLKDFVRRHKRKLVITGVVAVGAYTVSKLIQWKYDEWENQRVEEYTLLAKKQYHYESNQRTCTMTYFTFLPEIRNTIADNLDTETLLEALRLKPANKIEIWEQLKVLSVSQIVCSIVSSVVLLVMLKVQLNVVGGYIFVHSLETDKPVSSSTEMNEAQKDYMNNIRYFMETKLIDLINDCIKIVQARLKDVSLKEKLSHEKLQTLFKEIFDELKNGFSVNEQHPLCKYFVNVQWIENEMNKDEMYIKMTSETIDLFEGKDCSMVIEQCLESGLDYVVGAMKGSFLGNEDPEAIVSLENCSQSEFYKQIDLPLAKIIPLLNGQINEIFKVESNGYLDNLFAQGHLRQFSHNIYEAFSKKY